MKKALQAGEKHRENERIREERSPAVQPVGGAADAVDGGASPAVRRGRRVPRWPGW